MKRSIGKKIGLISGLAALVLIALGLSFYQSARQLVENSIQLTHSEKVVGTLNELLLLLVSVQSGARGYVLTGEDRYLTPHRATMEEMDQKIEDVQRLTAGNSEQATKFAALKPLVSRFLALMRESVELRKNEGFESATRAVSSGRGKSALDEIRNGIYKMRDYESNLLRRRNEAANRSARSTLSIILYGGILGLLLLSLAGFFITGAITNPIRELASGAEKLGAGNLEHRIEIRSKDELGGLALAFNRMAEKLGEAEHKLRESAGEIRDLYENAPCGYHSLDAEGRFIHINDTELGWLGYTRDEVIGKMRLPDVLKPDGARIFERDFPRLKENWAHNRELELVRKNGTSFPVLLNANAIRDQSGNFLSSRATVFDITDRKSAEQERDRFFTLALDMLCIAGGDGYFKRLNPAWQKTLGFTTAELLAKPYLEFVHPEDRAATIAEAQKLSGDQDTVHFENRYLCKDGSYKWLLWNATSFKQQHLIYATARDISGRKRAEEEIQRINRELETANSELLLLTLELESRVDERTKQLQAKREEATVMGQQLGQAAKLATMGELAASIAHELNNPMATVSLRVESLLAQVPKEDPMRHSLEVIEQEVERMGNLVANLLQFSRRSTHQVSTLVVPDEINATLDLIYYRLRNHGISLKREFSDSIPMLQADRQQLRQLLLNLFNNAVDVMPQGGTLAVRLSAEEVKNEAAAPGIAGSGPPPQSVVIQVIDTGIGMAPEVLARVSEPFYTTKPEGKGTGLGLAICKRIVQEHHGTLEISSEIAKGTTVRVMLPVSSHQPPRRSNQT